MANIKSAIKRIKITKRNNLRNKMYLSTIKTYTKKYLNAVLEYSDTPTEANKARIAEILSLVESKIDKAAKRNVLHKNTAARKKSKLTKILNSVSVGG